MKYPTGIQSNDYETNTGRRCFERRESKVQQRVLLPAAFEYNTEYTFLIKPWNTMAAAGEYGYNPDTWTPVTCSAVSFRPAAPTLQVVAAVDRYVKINWTEPNNHGLTIDQYQYSICRISLARMSQRATTLSQPAGTTQPAATCAAARPILLLVLRRARPASAVATSSQSTG